MQEELKEENIFLLNNVKQSCFNTKVMRLNKSHDFKKCFQDGKKIKNDIFILHYIENGAFFPRLGLSIAKKKIKKAVDRNKIKRVAREVFRKKKFKGIDMVLFLKNEKNYDHSQCFMLVNKVFNTLIEKNEIYINKVD